MSSNPLYGPYPEVDVEQLRAVTLLPRGDWRGPGCGDRCIRVFAEVMGATRREVIEAHDPEAHEAYVHALYLPTIVRTGPLTVDISSGRTWVDGQEIALDGTVRWGIIRTLALRLDCVVSLRELWVAVHGDDVPRVHAAGYWGTTMSNIRRMLGPARALLETRIERGYMLRYVPPQEGSCPPIS